MRDGTIMLRGDTCMREDELPAVEAEIHRPGLDMTALHNHLIGETPKVMFLHLSGHGTAVELARKVKAVLARTATPMTRESEEMEKEKVDGSAITGVPGQPAETEGDIVEYGFQRGERLTMHGETLPSTDALETAPEIKFQLLKDGRAITCGEMILTANEVAPVFHALAESGIEVDALHNHMSESRIAECWPASGDPIKSHFFYPGNAERIFYEVIIQLGLTVAHACAPRLPLIK